MNIVSSFIYLNAAIGWCGLLITPFVIFRYVGMPRSLYELVSKGDVNVAAVHIEDNELIPAIVALIEMVVKARDVKVAGGQEVTYPEILDELDYRPVLERVQQAQTKVRDIEVAVGTLMESCKPIWLIGIFHLFMVMASALDQIYVADPWRFPILLVLLTAAALSLALDLGLILRFEFKHSELLGKLSINRGRDDG